MSRSIEVPLPDRSRLAHPERPNDVEGRARRELDRVNDKIEDLADAFDALRSQEEELTERKAVLERIIGKGEKT